ncbi:MAG TPA: DUF5686 family protein, partial [Nitrosopumilaceae archaeon]|nr:DUF5686 family protein [Nitrosopumilaceae archaeon]
MKRIKPLAFAIIWLFAGFAFGQIKIKGRVLDKNQKPLPFVSVSVLNQAKGTICDIDGKFELSLTQEEINEGIQFSYVGYEQKMIKPAGTDLEKLIVILETKGIQLKELVVLPGENPANRIIKQVTRNRNKNNPEKIHSFSYTSYNKMIVTADFKTSDDSLMAQNNQVDSFQLFLRKQHLFLTESVSERLFLFPDRNNEKVIASRVSGFKQSPFTLLATQMQSFSFYDNQVNLFDIKYLNPISEGSTRKYFFIIEDTLYQEKDTVFVISFNPRKNKNFNAIKGLLYINTNGYAIQNVIAEPVGQDKNITVKIQQQYGFMEGKQWFPVQLNTDWIYNTVTIGDSKNKDGPKPKLKAISRTYIRSIVLNPQLKKKQFSEVELSIDKNADNQNETFWKGYRTDSLSSKDKLTYKVIDSIGKKANLDKKAFAFEALFTNQVQVKFINIDLKDVFRYNEYEGYRVGFGCHTNHRVSDFFNIGGYAAYGFRDKTFKYGGDLGFKLWKRN